ncbi:MAG: TRIC cation channel family protein [Candidatus Nanopelagicales bacterium]|nr:TRIC cation channel family protein [Candidatus Nanopelagicales bacterium]MDZ4250169.1 TRIC cation channel family protein [Candidatus Nanopelagicales bacterium]
MTWLSPLVIITAKHDNVADLLTSTPALPAWSTYAAVAFGALAGAAFAARRGFDVIGVLGLAVAQGMGGLLLEAILLQTGEPAVLTDGRYLLLVTIAAMLGFFFAGLIARVLEAAVLLDALSLGLLCGIGTHAAMRSGLDDIPSIFIGVCTAVGGLVLRDILAGQAPQIFRPGIFISVAALIGAILFVVLVTIGATLAFAQVATLFAVTILRMLSIRLRWQTREAHDLSDRVWHRWQQPAPTTDASTGAQDSATGAQDRMP